MHAHTACQERHVDGDNTKDWETREKDGERCREIKEEVRRKPRKRNHQNERWWYAETERHIQGTRETKRNRQRQGKGWRQKHTNTRKLERHTNTDTEIGTMNLEMVGRGYQESMCGASSDLNRDTSCTGSLVTQQILQMLHHNHMLTPRAETSRITMQLDKPERQPSWKGSHAEVRTLAVFLWWSWTNCSLQPFGGPCPWTCWKVGSNPSSPLGERGQSRTASYPHLRSVLRTTKIKAPGCISQTHFVRHTDIEGGILHVAPRRVACAMVALETSVS